MLRGIFFAALIAVSACASGTAIRTGATRPATNPDAVQIYLDPPANYEVVGLVTANSRAGFTGQQSLDYALAELRRQAAELGANGVLIESSGQGTGPIVGAVVGNTIIMSAGSRPNIQEVRGRAIIVAP